MPFRIHQSLQFLSVVISPATCLLFVSYMSILSDCYQSFINIKQTPLIPHCSWLHSGKLVCLQDISQPLVSWQKSYAHSGIVSRKNDRHQKKFSVAANFTHTYVAFFPYSHMGASQKSGMDRSAAIRTMDRECLRKVPYPYPFVRAHHSKQTVLILLLSPACYYFSSCYCCW